MAKHDENKDLRLISRICKTNLVSKTIKAPKSTVIGIRSWGRIDYLVNYCGYTFIWDDTVSVGTSQFNLEYKSSKKEKKEHSLSDKTHKSNKKREND